MRLPTIAAVVLAALSPAWAYEQPANQQGMLVGNQMYLVVTLSPGEFLGQACQKYIDDGKYPEGGTVDACVSSALYEDSREQVDPTKISADRKLLFPSRVPPPSSTVMQRGTAKVTTPATLARTPSMELDVRNAVQPLPYERLLEEYNKVWGQLTLERADNLRLAEQIQGAQEVREKELRAQYVLFNPWDPAWILFLFLALLMFAGCAIYLLRDKIERQSNEIEIWKHQPSEMEKVIQEQRDELDLARGRLCRVQLSFVDGRFDPFDEHMVVCDPEYEIHHDGKIERVVLMWSSRMNRLVCSGREREEVAAWYEEQARTEEKVVQLAQSQGAD